MKHIEEELKQYIQERILRGTSTIDVTIDDALIATGRLDSLGLMQLLAHVQQRWKVDLLTLAGPDDFVSITTLAQAIRKYAQG